MYLRNAPVFFEKDGQRKTVYHTVTADELTVLGWKRLEESDIQRNEAEAQPIVFVEEAKPSAPEEIKPEPEASLEPVSLLDMTKNQLIDYAATNGIVINPYAAKSEILAACLEASNG